MPTGWRLWLLIALSVFFPILFHSWWWLVLSALRVQLSNMDSSSIHLIVIRLKHMAGTVQAVYALLTGRVDSFGGLRAVPLFCLDFLMKGRGVKKGIC